MPVISVEAAGDRGSKFAWDNAVGRVEQPDRRVYESHEDFARAFRFVMPERLQVGGWDMQQRNHKTDEPSMEDILASIRKIISEEPAGTKPASPAAAAAEPVKPAVMPQPAAAAVAPTVAKPSPTPMPMPTASFEPPKPKAEKPTVPTSAAAPVAGATASRLSDVMRELAPTAVPVSTTGPATTTLSFHDDLSDLVESEILPPPPAPPARNTAPAPRTAAETPTKAEPAAPKPGVPPAAAKPSSPAPAAPVAASPVPAKGPAAPRKPELGPGDLGAFIPATAESIAVAPGRSPSLPFANDLKLSEPQPLEHAPRTIALGIPNLEMAVPIAATPAKAPAKPANPAPKPAAAAPAAPQPAAKAAPVIEAVAAEEIDRVADPVTAAQTALGALAVGLASAAPNPLPVAVPVPAAELAPKPAAAKAATAAAAAMPSTALAVSEPVVGEGQLVRRSLDDTIVGMLRPMIRDWLDTNLPEMVEKALQQELQERKGGDR